MAPKFTTTYQVQKFSRGMWIATVEYPFKGWITECFLKPIRTQWAFYWNAHFNLKIMALPCRMIRIWSSNQKVEFTHTSTYHMFASNTLVKKKVLQRCKGLPCFFNVRILLWMSTTPQASKDFFWCLLRGFLQQLLENPGGLVCFHRWQRHLSTNFDKCSSSKPPRFQASLECRSVSSHPDSRRCQNNVDLHVHEAKSSMPPHFLLAKYVIDISTARIWFVDI